MIPMKHFFFLRNNSHEALALEDLGVGVRVAGLFLSTRLSVCLEAITRSRVLLGVPCTRLGVTDLYAESW